MSYEKMFMVPAEDPAAVNFFKQWLVEDPTLTAAAKLMSSKMSILNDTGTAPAFKTAAVKQIDPKVEMYIKRMRQLPTSLLVNADPKELKKALAHEEGDLVTPVQQKLLKRLIHQSKEPRPPVKKEPASKQVPAPVVKRTPVTTIPVEHAATPPPPPLLPPSSSVTPPPSPVKKRKSSWEELPIFKMPSPGP